MQLMQEHTQSTFECFCGSFLCVGASVCVYRADTRNYSLVYNVCTMLWNHFDFRAKALGLNMNTHTHSLRTDKLQNYALRMRKSDTKNIQCLCRNVRDGCRFGQMHGVVCVRSANRFHALRHSSFEPNSFF